MERHLHVEEWVAVDDVAVRGRAFDGGSLLTGEALAARFHAALSHSPRAEMSPIETRQPPQIKACRSNPSEILDAVCDVAATLEGFFAVVIDATAHDRIERTYLVADGARSIPLYYDDNGSIVSDRGRAVKRAVDGDRDPIAESELLLTRYVTGPETIWSRIYSTQPGEVVAIGNEEIVRRTYREHWPTAERAQERSTAEAKTLLREGLETALDRAECVAGDRPVVVPLSGGYDSRLLAASLVERGREVIGFTFGRIGHPDVEMSRGIAAALGIEWHHVSYSESEWRRWYHGDDCRAYRNNAFGGDSLPFLAEWPALRTLVDEHRIPKDALFCPGHSVTTPSERLPAFTGDSTNNRTGDSATNLTDDLANNTACDPAINTACATNLTGDSANDRTGDSTGTPTIEPSVEGLIEHVLDTHYTLWDWDDLPFRNAASERIRRGLLGGRSQSEITDPESAAAAYERWEWRGRMATFTNGDLRAYENHGLDWWLPLWDPAYVRAWERLSSNYRRNRRLHKTLAVERYRAATDKQHRTATDEQHWTATNEQHRTATAHPISRSAAARTDRTLSAFDRSLSLLRHTPVRQFTHHDGEWLPPFLVSPSRFGDPGTHPLAWYGAVDSNLLERFCEPPDFYALRVLAETGRLDFADPSSPIPDGTTITLPMAERTGE